MNHFCTYFDYQYLTRGMALHQSLCESGEPFHLYILAFDDLTQRLLRRLDLPSVTLIPLAEFETEELLAAKSKRSPVEYYWTCTPALITFCLNRFSLPWVTYIDADVLFYSAPSVLIEEMASDSVLLISHRYTARFDQTARSGKYCVQFMAFKNDNEGRSALHSWEKSCLEWCYARVEKGKFGDQKYLDNWPAIFPGVHELLHEGGGLAPWNIQQYNVFSLPDGRLAVINRMTDIQYPIIFYHFHGLRYLAEDRVDLGAYPLSPATLKHIYVPYMLKLKEAENRLTESDAIQYFSKYTFSATGLKELILFAKRILRLRRYRIYRPSRLTGVLWRTSLK